MSSLEVAAGPVPDTQQAAGRRRALSLGHSSLFMIGSVVATSGLGFLYWVLAARLLPKATVGLGSSATSAVSLTGLLASLGLGPFLMHRLPKLDGAGWSRLLSRAAVMLGLAGLGGGLVLVPILRAVSPAYGGVTDGVTGLPLVVLFVVSQTYSVVSDGVCIGERRADLVLVRATVFSVLKLLTLPLINTSLLSPGKMVLLTWGFAQLAAVAVQLAWFLASARYRFQPALRGPSSPRRLVVRELTAHWFTLLGGQLPQLALPVVVVARGGTSLGASFYVGWAIGASLFILSYSVSQSLFAEGRNTDAPIGRLLRRAAKLIAAYQIPCIVVMWFVGPMVLQLFGSSYGGQARALIRVLALAAVVDGITNVGVAVARLTARFGLAAVLNVGMAAIAIGTAYLMVPSVGVTAGGWAYMIANGAGSVFVLIAVVRLLRRPAPVIDLP